MKAIKIGNQYQIYDSTIETFDLLPAKTYNVCFSKTSGFYLVERVDMVVNEKIYGVHYEKVEKVINAFPHFERNLGVILSGNKGIGKSLFAKLLCIRAVGVGMPVLIVDQYIPGIASYIEEINQEVLVLFDEFDKTFYGNEDTDPQATMLSLFDGTSFGKKLFVITCNNVNRLNDFLVNRPGRFHYHFRFGYPTADEIREYLSDKISECYYGEIDNVIEFSCRVSLNYDCLRAIAFELNQGTPFKTAIQDLNILNTEEGEYRVYLMLKDGQRISYNSYVYLDLFDSDEGSTGLNFDMPNGKIITVRFDPTQNTYNPSVGGVIIPGNKLSVHSRYSDEISEEMLSEYRNLISCLVIKMNTKDAYKYNAV